MRELKTFMKIDGVEIEFDLSNPVQARRYHELWLAERETKTAEFGAYLERQLARTDLPTAERRILERMAKRHNKPQERPPVHKPSVAAAPEPRLQRSPRAPKPPDPPLVLDGAIIREYPDGRRIETVYRRGRWVSSRTLP